MEDDQNMGLPSGKTCALKEYAGLEGNISDPYGKPLEDYIKCRDEIKDCLERVIGKISEKNYDI